MAVPRILLVIPLANHLNRRLLNGLLEYARANGPWQVNIVPDEDPSGTRLAVRDGRPDVAVVLQEEERGTTDFRALDAPTVFINPVARVRLPSNRQCVFLRRDYVGIGRVAARHFLDRNYVNFAFAGGTRNAGRVREMANGFSSSVIEAGRTFIAYPPPTRQERRSFGLEEPRMTEWLRSLPKPVAIFTPHDMRARQVLNACLAARIRVPEDVGILGMGNDRMLCDLSTPSISSVDIYPERAGHQAAQLADAILRGHDAPKDATMDFASVVTRHSTDSRLIDDPLVVRALDLADRHLSDATCGIDAIARNLHVSRRTLEIRTRRILGRSLGAEIAAMRLARASALLLGTDIPISEVAERTGFCDASYFVLRFRHRYGVTPAAWRKQPSCRT